MSSLPSTVTASMGPKIPLLLAKNDCGCFLLSGKKFEYGKFIVDDIKFQGSYFNNVFTIANANFQSDKSYGKIAKARLRLTPASNPLLRVREQSGEIEKSVRTKEQAFIQYWNNTKTHNGYFI